MAKYYSNEKNVQILISLLKERGIKKVVASPGTTNLTFVGSLMCDPFFEIYSSVDERSAAYIACGLAAESGEAVVLTCTGATASRNYLPGLTEAYYRKLPILAVTATQGNFKIGHHIPQVIDRTSIQNDVAKLSVDLPIVKDENDLWQCEINANRALLELKRTGGGPVHINLTTTYSRNFDVKELPTYRCINRISPLVSFPELPQGRIGIFIGAHLSMSKYLIELIDRFCATNNAVVFCDHTSSYYGAFRVQFALAAIQQASVAHFVPDLTIHIGEISGDYPSGAVVNKNNVWRVNEDGEIRDTFRGLRYVFEMSEELFFEYYSNSSKDTPNTYFDECRQYVANLHQMIPELPFSNIWIASQLAHRIPEGAAIHLGILNTLRSWNFFELPNSVTSFSNVGGFGIDGCVSSLIGASLANLNKLYYGIIGDLAFFYDLNAIGNRHISNNLRILLVNNGKGTEFRNFNHPASVFGDSADEYMAAAGHYGHKSQLLVKNYAENLGFEYFSANNKEEFAEVYDRFIIPAITDRPILFEVFTDSQDESDALMQIGSLVSDEKNLESSVKDVARQLLGEKGVSFVKKIIK